MEPSIKTSSSTMAPRVDELVEEGASRLDAAGIPSARLDAEVLLAEVLGVDRVAIHTRGSNDVAASAVLSYRAMLGRRAGREPLAYIVGHREFWSLEIDVTSAVLIPRPETEVVVESALGLLRGQEAPEPSVCDVGTGSGCIAVVLACEAPQASIVAVDISDAALDVARRNVEKHSVGARVELVRSDLFAAIRGRRFDLLVANPPYISTAALAELEPELQREPRGALEGGTDGLGIIRRLLADAGETLKPQGFLVMEIGADQRNAVLQLATGCGFTDLRVQADYAGMPRVLIARAS